MNFLIAAVIAYLLGSILSAKIICKFTGQPDPSTKGSGNPGATNVLRFAGEKLALMTLGGDILKGLIAVIIGRILGVQGFFLGLVGLAAFVGHLYPLYYKFKGGKGVSTGLGVLLGLSPVVGILALVTWVIVAAIFHYSSLAALVTAVLSLVYALLFTTPTYLLPILIMVGLLVWKHYANIQRLLAGTEDKMSVDLMSLGKSLWAKGKTQVEELQKKRMEQKVEKKTEPKATQEEKASKQKSATK
ncbi:MAG: glycerol-3-phosphate 1-O-acyltransferase PlsY [Gammaproteobacteria bacterium]|nr:glycerol-3-phosphate 1-O-acyltransferase PlsY [Gammaproteobacteria bacterium]